jgi:phosphate:Na+ symporter
LVLRKILLPIIFAFLAYGFWSSAEFKTVAAGVAIFLFGMLSLEEGFKTFTGGTLENFLRASTDRLWKSLTFGVVTTSIMQSSSLVSIITISFLSAGLLGLTSAIGIIFGANLGTTTGAWLVAGFGLKVNLSAYAMPMLVFGIILLFQKARNLKGAGYILAGLGFLFLGIHYMKEGFDSFGQTIDLAEYAMTGYPGVFAFAGIGILATVVMQSSHATLVLILAALAAQQISYENALALAIGSNVGTTITAIIGSLGAGVDGRRLAAAHLVFNLVTGLIAITFIYQLMDLVSWLSVHLGIASDNYTLQLAVFHSLFNALGIVVMLPLLDRLVLFLERIIPAEEIEVEKPRYLTNASMGLAEVAVEAVRKETIRLYDLAVGVINDGLSIRQEVFESETKVKRIVKRSARVIDEDIDDLYERKLKALYGAIVEYVIRVRGGYAEGRAREELAEIRGAGQHVIEAVKGVKHLKKNLTRFMKSDNAHIRKEYDKLRRLVVRVLREIEALRSADDQARHTLSLDRLKLEIEEKLDKIGNGLDTLIREDLIDVQMATSMMNDISYTREICWDLVDAGSVLFSEMGLEDKAAMRSIALDEHEIIEMMNQGEEGTTR